MLYLLGIGLVGAGLYQHQSSRGDRPGFGLALTCALMGTMWPVAAMVAVVTAPAFLIRWLRR